MSGFASARVLGCMVSGCVIALVAAQDPQRPAFRAKVDAVTLDVSVMDKSGKPVTDLTAEDFEVVEQGKPQKIEAFELVNLATRPAMSPNLYHDIRTMNSQEEELARRESRVIVVFLNEYHVLLEDQWQVRQQVADVVRAIDPRDLVAIMYPLTPTVGLSFSRDHDAQAREIETFVGREGKYDDPIKNAIEEEWWRRSLRNPGLMEKFRRDAVRTALQGLCTFLGTLRDSRKSVLFVSDWAPGGMTGIPFDDFKQIQRAASRANTAIYTYDPKGLIAGGRPNQWLYTLAEETGGRPTVNVNNGRPGMLRMIADSEAYYLIGYTSTENTHDGRFHYVNVKLKRPGLQMRSKPGYWAFDADAIERSAAPPPPPVADEVNAALAAAETPEQGRPMLAWAGFDRDPAGATIVNVVWESVEGRAPVDHADIIAASDTSSFRGRGQKTLSFPAKPGDLSIRVVAAGADGSPVDTAFLALTVPPDAAVQVATPRFFKGTTMKAVTAADALPTASREFTRQDQVIVRVHAWTRSGGAPAISARLLDDHGVILRDLLPRGDTLDIPVSGLGLGRYVIEVTAVSGSESAKALAAFRVR